jgi:hypothetical protein
VLFNRKGVAGQPPRIHTLLPESFLTSGSSVAKKGNQPVQALFSFLNANPYMLLSVWGALAA